MGLTTAESDREFVGDTFGPPTPEQWAGFEKARRKRGRPLWQSAMHCAIIGRGYGNARLDRKGPLS